MNKIGSILIFLLVASELVVSRKSSRKTKSIRHLSELQKRYLEEIQVNARKGGLPESEWKAITQYDEEVCYEVDCLESALEVMTATNFSVDPCEPKMWLQFACARRVNGPDSINQLERLMRIVEKQTLALLEDKTGIHEDDFLWKEAHHYYHQCKQKSLADDQDLLDIMKYSERYGNWPILTNKDPGEKFNWLDLVADLNRFERAGFIPYLLQVNVPDFLIKQGPVELNMGRTVVHVSNSDLQSMLTLVQKKVGRKKPVRIDHIAPMATFMAIVSGATVVQENSTLMSIKEFQNRTDAFISEHKMEVKVNWLNFFKRVLKGVETIKVEPEWKINVSFNQIMGVLASVDLYLRSGEKKERWAVANILQFQLVSLLLQESTVLLDDKNSFRCVELSGDRKDICLGRTKEAFGYALGATYVKTFYDDKIVTPAVNKIVSSIKRGYTDVIGKTSWMESSTKEFLQDKIQSIKAYIGYPSWIKERDKLEEFFKGLEISTDKNSSYPMNYMALNTWRLTKKRSWSYKHHNLTTWKGFQLFDMEWNHYPATVQAQYHKAINEARIEAGVIQKPIFGVKRPGFMNFGGLGMILAHEIGHSFDIIGRLFNKHGENEKEYWDKASLKKYLEWIQQVADQYGSEPYRLSETSAEAETIDPWKTINEDIADILAVYISYHSYQTYLKDLEKKGEKEKILPGLKSFSPKKLFYMKYANMWCDNKDVQDKFKDMLSDHSSGNTRATLPLKYSKQFARAFGCNLPKPLF